MARKRQLNVLLEPVLASPAMKRLDRVLAVVARKEVSVLFFGESGTGKEVLARRVHELSPRRGGPFVPINCAAIPEALFESELFGHAKGAFTGADQLALGKIEAAGGGTLFLDEIGEMPIQMQAKLLRFLESRRFMRVGDNRKIAVDVRIVCATLRPLDDEVRAGRFRPDLYYRIQGVSLRVPPLRERKADIGPLIEQLLVEHASRHEVAPAILTRSAVAALRRHAWPGNVRELKNVLEYMCLMRPGKRVRARDLPELMVPATSEGSGDRPSIALRLDRTLEEAMDEFILGVLDRHAGNKTRAAAQLGIGLRTLQRRTSARG